MWTRQELKQRAKGLFKANYWKAVLVALVLSIIIGGGYSGGSGAGISSMFSGMQAANTTSAQTYGSIKNMEDISIYDMLDEDGYQQSIPNLPEEFYDSESGDMPVGLMLITAGMLTVIILIAIVIAIAVDILLLNPLEVGVRRFFSVNLFEKAQIRELAYGFDHSYKNVIHVMFFRDLYTVLWSLLFIIPGIVKSYEYRMIPYLLAEYPEMTKEDAFAISKYMMSGNKWKTFVLDLSFILWFLGSLCTLGLLGLFYGDPYYSQTGAVLYDTLKNEKQPFARNAGVPAEPFNGQNAMYQQPVQNAMYQQPVQNPMYQQPAQNDNQGQPPANAAEPADNGNEDAEIQE